MLSVFTPEASPANVICGLIAREVQTAEILGLVMAILLWGQLFVCSPAEPSKALYGTENRTLCSIEYFLASMRVTKPGEGLTLAGLFMRQRSA